MNGLKLIHFVFFLFFFGLNANAFTAESLAEKESINETWKYKWTQGGMLKKVIRPDRKHVDFTYDALGRRLTKTYKDQTTHFVWDGNVPLHEWTSGVDDAITQVNEDGEREIITPENLTTWVFEDGTFIPMAKMQGFKSYSIITDHLGTPTEAYDEDGKKVWSCHLDIFGGIRKIQGERSFISFRYQGQYDDVETDLYYNRFRYYSAENGTYISQDPIGINSGEPNLYAYVVEVNALTDPLGLDTSSDALALNNSMDAAGVPRPDCDHAAHHIVQSNATDVEWEAARKHMTDLGVDINSADNGIFLPRSGSTDLSNAPEMKGTLPHSRVHNKNSKKIITDRIMAATDKKGVKKALNDLKKMYRAGDISLLSDARQAKMRC
ncbi:MAG: RHS repeat-associated core domain-containing protein [Crocinitomicaceae bacterium]|nr:RHS repeat-associated core domain-containing protein [Crocinitomicaceae bacterium]